jgi:hypothetical protein
VPTDPGPIGPIPVDEPTQVVVVVAGGDTGMSGLTPPLSISVAPSGVVLPDSPNPVIEPGVDIGDAIPLDDIVADAQLDAVPAKPPPSKVELVPLIPEVPPVPPLRAELVPLVPLMTELTPIDAQFTLGAGLRPPGFISVAPNGTPVAVLPTLDPRIPRGDVAGIPGVVVTVCA